ncbi:hypothetical protein ACFLUV_05730, partial [Elusimicrobiota bacterium]
MIREILGKKDTSLLLKRITLIAYLVIISALKLGFRSKIPVIVPIILIIWIFSTYLFDFVIKKREIKKKNIESIYFGDFALEVIMLTFVVYYIGAVQWIGSIFYILIILYASLSLPNVKRLLISLEA